MKLQDKCRLLQQARPERLLHNKLKECIYNPAKRLLPVGFPGYRGTTTPGYNFHCSPNDILRPGVLLAESPAARLSSCCGGLPSSFRRRGRPAAPQTPTATVRLRLCLAEGVSGGVRRSGMRKDASRISLAAPLLQPTQCTCCGSLAHDMMRDLNDTYWLA